MFSQIVDMLLLEKKIEESVVTTVKEYIKTGQIPLKISPELSLSGKKFLTSWKTTHLFTQCGKEVSRQEGVQNIFPFQRTKHCIGTKRIQCRLNFEISYNDFLDMMFLTIS